MVIFLIIPQYKLINSHSNFYNRLYSKFTWPEPIHQNFQNVKAKYMLINAKSILAHINILLDTSTWIVHDISKPTYPIFLYFLCQLLPPPHNPKPKIIHP